MDVNDQKAVMVALPHTRPISEFSVRWVGRSRADRSSSAASAPAARSSTWTAGWPGTEAIGARDGNLRRFGWYGLSADSPDAALAARGRFDSWDATLSQELTLFDATERQMTVGASYLLDPSTKVALNVIRQTFPNVANPPSGTIVLVAFQAVW